nr:homeobox protein ceh-28-like [Lepeophtheirus salmonis]
MALNFSISSILNNSSSSRSAVNNPVKTEIITTLNWQAYGYLSNFAVQAAVANSNQESGSQETSPNSSFHTLPQMSPPQTPLSQSNNGQPQQPVIMPPHWSQKQQGHETGVLRRRYTTEQTNVLMEKYKKSRYVPRQEMAVLASATGLTMLQVKIWFQNRRLKDRKKMQKSRSQSPELEV